MKCLYDLFKFRYYPLEDNSASLLIKKFLYVPIHVYPKQRFVVETLRFTLSRADMYVDSEIHTIS